MSEWKIYEPITEFGKKIASLLRYDNMIRLDIHEYLEKAEPELIQLRKDADRYNEMFLTDTVRLSEVDYMDIMTRVKKWDDLNDGFIELENIISDALKFLDQMPNHHTNYLYKRELSAWKEKMRRILVREEWGEINEKW